MSTAETPNSNHSDGDKSAGDDNYQVIALRYRPQTFTDLVGQEHVWRGLVGAIQGNRVGHAYLFTGARGVGKTSTARIFAKALNCEKGMTTQPCGVCDSCASIANSSDIDVIEMDGASNRGIDEIRQLRQNASIRPSRSRFKIFIIDEVHMLTRDAFNALLKTLEEPPDHVKFIFCTTEAEKIPITILSRCQRHDFSNVETQKIAQRLQEIATRENITIEPDALSILARRAGGSMRDSQSLLEQMMALGASTITTADVHAMLGTTDNSRLLRLVQMLANRDTAAALGEFGSSVQAGADVGQLFDQLLGSLRDVMVVSVGCSSSALVHHLPNDFATIQAIAEQLGLETILAMVQIVDQTLARLKYLSQPRTLAELALVRMSRLSELQNVSQIISALKSGTLPQLTIDVQGNIAHSQNGDSQYADAKKKVERSDAASSSNDDCAPDDHSTIDNGIAPSISSSQDVNGSYHETNGASLNGSHLKNSANGSQSYDENNKQIVEKNGDHLEEREDYASESSAIDAVDLSEESVKELWPQVLAELAGMVQDSAKAGEISAFRAPNQLTIAFGKQHSFAKRFCEKPESLAIIQQKFAELSGHPIRLSVVFDDRLNESSPAVANVATKPGSPKVPQQQRLQQPLVKKAIELFGGRVMRVEEPS